MQSRIELLSDPAVFHMADDWYDYASVGHFWFQWRLDALLDLLTGIDPGQRLLEVGCGNGVARRQLEAHYGRAVDGCDVNERALRLAPPGRGRLCLYDIRDRRPEWADYFDTIFLLDVLEHVEETETLLDALAYHLKPGGLLVLNVPALECLHSRYDELVGHVRRYRAGTLTAQLEGSGFRLLGHRYWGLTLLPIGLLRKLVVHLASPERVITCGIQPPSALADRVLRALMHAERWLVPHPWIGTSLAAVAERLPKSPNSRGA